MKSIKEILIERDGLSPEEAEDLIEEAREDLFARLEEGEMPFDICREWFGLERDYIENLLP